MRNFLKFKRHRMQCLSGLGVVGRMIVGLVLLVGILSCSGGGPDPTPVPVPPVTYMLSVTQGTGTTGNPTISQSYTAGNSVSYSYSTTGAYSNLVVQIDGSTVSSSGAITMNAPHTITTSATPPPPQTLTINLGAGTTGTPSSTQSYAYGTNVPYTYSTTGGYTNLVVTLDGAAVPASGTITMNAPHTITASATPPLQTLTVNLGAGTTGTPSSTQSYSNGTSVPYSYSTTGAYSNLVVLLDGSPVGASGSITMNGNHALATSASLIPCLTLVTATNPTGGAVLVNTAGNCSGGFTASTPISLTAPSRAGYTFSSWSGSGGTFSSTTSSTTTFTISAPASVTANYIASYTQVVLKVKATGSLPSGKLIGGWQTTLITPPDTVGSFSTATRLSIMTRSAADRTLATSAFSGSGATPGQFQLTGSYNPPDGSQGQPYLILLCLGNFIDPYLGHGLGEIATVVFDLKQGATVPTKGEFSLTGSQVNEASVPPSPLQGVSLDFDISYR